MSAILCLMLSLVLVSSYPAHGLAAPLGDLGMGEAPRVQPVPDEGRYRVAIGFFERLFGGGRKKKKAASDKPKKAKAGPKKPAVPFVKTVSKDPDATVIAIFGDEFGQDIAYGLRDAFSQTPDVKIDIHTIGRTGLVYRSRKNPMADLAALSAKKPFSFGVVLVGLNDRVKSPAIKGEDGQEITPAFDFRTRGWSDYYEERIDDIRRFFAIEEKPLYWVGLPPVSNKKLSADLLFLNDVIRARLSGREERFIDIWDAFANEEGGFTSRGPDLSGREVRLRQKNGIRFNKAGRRKLAFFVEKLVIRALSQSVDEAALPDFLDPADEAALKEGRGASRGIYVVRKPPLDANVLVNPSSFDQKLMMEQRASAPDEKAPDLRVDQFIWTDGQ